MNEYSLKLTEQEINHILLILSKQPYEEVFEVIGNIREQAISQESSLQIKKNDFLIKNEDTGV